MSYYDVPELYLGPLELKSSDFLCMQVFAYFSRFQSLKHELQNMRNDETCAFYERLDYMIEEKRLQMYQRRLTDIRNLLDSRLEESLSISMH
jgi:hypothetical protein